MLENQMPITLISNKQENAEGIRIKEGLIHVLCSSGALIKLGQVRSNRMFETFLLEQLGKLDGSGKA
jgi:hypothetical protein|tara:strand:+ start:740 stop:940 length:201 start_codon:yes stop_codon:yes gene_type:complete